MKLLARLGVLGTASTTLAVAATCLWTFNTTAQAAENQPPPGYTALFNGKDLSGWCGGETFDPRRLQAMSPSQRAAQIAKWTATMHQINPKTGKPHWYVQNGELINDGFGAYATTTKQFRNFELLLQYKTVPLADSGVYLRGCPQVQIWDHTNKREFRNGAEKGSGGLWNNNPGAPGKDPLFLADKPFGQWNSYRVIMVGSRVSVWLNDQLVVDHAVMDNYYNRKLPVPPIGPIELQTHGGPIHWRNIFIRKIGPKEANRILERYDERGFKTIFDGQDWKGWAGPLDNYQIVDHEISCRPGKGGTIYTKANYANFIVRIEFKLPLGGNNGLAIRYPGHGDTAYDGMCELQVLDDNYEKDTGDHIDPRQAHGSAYGMVAAARGYQYPIGDWNYEVARIDGSTIRVELNGTPILNCDLSKVHTYMHNSAHPGKNRTSGHFGFAGHNDPVCFRDIQIKRLP